MIIHAREMLGYLKNLFMHIQSILLPKLYTCISLLNLYAYILEVFLLPKDHIHTRLCLICTHAYSKNLCYKRNYISCVFKYLATQITFQFNKVFGEVSFAIYMQHTYIL